jgi:hypothetical protein
MALDTYAELQVEIADWLDRPALVSAIPTFVELCEARMRRAIRTKSVTVTNVAITASATSVATPTGALEIVSLSIDDSVEGGSVTLVSYPELMRHRAHHPTTGTPEVACIVGDTIHFSPAANAAYSLAVEYEGPFVPLSDGAPSNWILTSHPDLYLYGSLAEAAPYMKDDARVPIWNGRFLAALEECELQRERRRWPGPVNVPVPRTFSDSPPR